MKITRSIQSVVVVFLFSFLSFGALAVAQKTSQPGTTHSPDTVVANLYKQHKRRSPFFQTRSRALLDMYFVKSLGDLIWKEASNSKGEVGLLDGDPLYNAQDMEIKNFAVHKPVLAKGQAEVTVTFENFGKKEQIVFVLLRSPASWKIANIKYSDGTDLVGILSAGSGARHTSEIKVFLIAVGDNGKAGKKIGCDDSLVPVTRAIKNPGAPLKAALQELLSLPGEYGENPKLENFWKGRKLKLQSVSVRQQVATIHFTGEVFVAGVCDEPRIKSQIEETARQFSSVKKVRVFVGTRTLAEAIR